MNGYELLAQYKKQIKECFTVPNDWLPEEFQDQRTDSVSLADIERKCDARDKCTLSNFEEESIERAKRVQAYRSQIDRGEEIDYIPRQGGAGRAYTPSQVGDKNIYILYSRYLLTYDDVYIRKEGVVC